ncbi:MAG TPA: hypothetical protein VKT78_00205 [Fimbriimonadaceae bacterium]|nr:hypothetical protein [Fimbriimonadaceae bacterium]
MIIAKPCGDGEVEFRVPYSVAQFQAAWLPLFFVWMLATSVLENAFLKEANMTSHFFVVTVPSLAPLAFALYGILRLTQWRLRFSRDRLELFRGFRRMGSVERAAIATIRFYPGEAFMGAGYRFDLEDRDGKVLSSCPTSVAWLVWNPILSCLASWAPAARFVTGGPGLKPGERPYAQRLTNRGASVLFVGVVALVSAIGLGANGFPPLPAWILGAAGVTVSVIGALEIRDGGIRLARERAEQPNARPSVFDPVAALVLQQIGVALPPTSYAYTGSTSAVRERIRKRQRNTLWAVAAIAAFSLLFGWLSSLINSRPSSPLLVPFLWGETILALGALCVALPAVSEYLRVEHRVLADLGATLEVKEDAAWVVSDGVKNPVSRLGSVLGEGARYSLEAYSRLNVEADGRWYTFNPASMAPAYPGTPALPGAAAVAL